MTRVVRTARGIGMAADLRLYSELRVILRCLMPTGSRASDDRHSPSVDLSIPDVAEGEIIDEPPRKELILMGRASLVDLGQDPDDWVDEETEEELRQATPKGTIEAICWGWGRIINYCGKTGRRHDPPTAATMRQYIKDHWHMTKADGKKRGRGGQPYAPKTVELAVYTVAMVCNRMGWANPVRNPLVHDQLEAYELKFERNGHRTHESLPVLAAQSVALARTCDLGTINGLRNATMLRLQFDTGCRADELCNVQAQDVQWVSREKVLITFYKTKGHKPRTVAVQAAPGVDWDVDPARLLAAYMAARRAAGFPERGPLFLEVFPGPRRKDFETSGILAGKFRTEQIAYGAYEAVFNRAVDRSGINLDPLTEKPTRHYTTHGNRAGFLTEFSDTGQPMERAAARTGHSPSSRAFYKYFRSDRKWDEHNAGLAIRRAQAVANDKDGTDR